LRLSRPACTHSVFAQAGKGQEARQQANPLGRTAAKKAAPEKPRNLDAEMDSYWAKSGDPSILAKLAAEKEAKQAAAAAAREAKRKTDLESSAKKLEDDMDSYWSEKKPKQAAGEAKPQSPKPQSPKPQSPKAAAH
jgi:hypothetical protein